MTAEHIRRMAEAVERGRPEECLAAARWFASSLGCSDAAQERLGKMDAGELKRSFQAFLKDASGMHPEHLEKCLEGLSCYAGTEASWKAIEDLSPGTSARIHASPLAYLRRFESHPEVKQTLVRSRIFMLDGRCFQSYVRFIQRLLAQPPAAMRAYLSQPLALPFDRVLIVRPQGDLGIHGGGLRIAIEATRVTSGEWLLHPFDLLPSLDPPSLDLESPESAVTWDGGEFRFRNGRHGKPGEPGALPVDGLSPEDRTLLMVYWLFNHLIPKLRGATCREMRLERPIDATVPDSWGARARFVNDRYILVTKPRASEPVVGTPVSFPVEYACRWEVRGHWRRTRCLGKDPTGAYGVDGRTWVRSHVKGPEGKPLARRTRLVPGGEAGVPEPGISGKGAP